MLLILRINLKATKMSSEGKDNSKLCAALSVPFFFSFLFNSIFFMFNFILLVIGSVMAAIWLNC